MDFIRDRRDEGLEEGGCRMDVGVLFEPGEGELRSPVDGDEEPQFSLRRLHFGNVDVEEADRVGLELLLCGLVAFGLRQPADPMPLQATMQRRTRQVRDGRPQRIETIVERQQRMPAEGDYDRLFLDRQNCGPRLFRAGREISDRRAAAPLANGLQVDPVTPGQRPQALLMVWTASPRRHQSAKR